MMAGSDVFINNIGSMLTPRKHTDKRLPRTADTEPYEKNAVGLGRTEMSEYEDVRRRIDFNEIGNGNKKAGKLRVMTEGPVIQKQKEAQYRKTMLKFLDNKFAESYLNIEPKTINLQKPHKMKAQESTRGNRVDSIKLLFKQYVEAIHKFKMSQMSEFNFGNILLHLGFIRNLLEDRAIITRLWQQLAHPAIFCPFLYLAYIYCRIELKQRKYDLYEQIKPFQNMFLDQGYRYSLEDISFFLSLAQSAAKSRQSSLLLANRQNRATFSSLNRSLSRKHR